MCRSYPGFAVARMPVMLSHTVPLPSFPDPISYFLKQPCHILSEILHVPILFINGYSFEWIFWHSLYVVMGRVLMVWIYNNAEKSLFSMALTHSTFGLFWSLWPTENLHLAVPFYDPRIMAFTAIFFVVIVTFLWGPKTLAQYRFSRVDNKKNIPS